MQLIDDDYSEFLLIPRACQSAPLIKNLNPCYSALDKYLNSSLLTDHDPLKSNRYRDLLEVSCVALFTTSIDWTGSTFGTLFTYGLT